MHIEQGQSLAAAGRRSMLASLAVFIATYYLMFAKEYRHLDNGYRRADLGHHLLVRYVHSK